MAEKELAAHARSLAYYAHEKGEGLVLDPEQAYALWESILRDGANLVKAQELARLNFERTIATLHKIADDANQRRTETPDRMQAEWYQGMHHGLTRAISVLEGRG